MKVNNEAPTAHPEAPADSPMKKLSQGLEQALQGVIGAEDFSWDDLRPGEQRAIQIVNWLQMTLKRDQMYEQVAATLERIAGTVLKVPRGVVEQRAIAFGIVTHHVRASQEAVKAGQVARKHGTALCTALQSAHPGFRVLTDHVKTYQRGLVSEVLELLGRYKGEQRHRVPKGEPSALSVSGILVEINKLANCPLGKDLTADKVAQARETHRSLFDGYARPEKKHHPELDDGA